MVHYTSPLLRRWQSGDVAGLKPVYGGSTPPLLVSSLFELAQRRALQTCGKGEGSREVIQYLLRLIPQLKLHVLRRRLLR